MQLISIYIQILCLIQCVLQIESYTSYIVTPDPRISDSRGSSNVNMTLHHHHKVRSLLGDFRYGKSIVFAYGPNSSDSGARSGHT